MALVEPHWWRSAGVRFGFAYAILFGFSTIAVVAFVWWSTAGRLDRQTWDEIRADSTDLSGSFERGGVGALVAAVQGRLDGDAGDNAIYLLADPDHHEMVGNLPGWPQGVTDDTEWWALRLKVWGVPIEAQLRNVTLSTQVGPYHLLVGRNGQLHTLLWGKLSDAAPWIIIVMALLGVIGAVTVRRLFVSMLSEVSKTASAISSGDLSSRVALTGRGDEFDELARTINDMLDRIGRLMDGVREVSNAIAHDLRTPIARARARLEDATRDCTTEAELRAAVDRAIADLDAVVGVFHALLRIAEIEAGARRSAFAALDLAPLLRDLAELYEPAAEARGQTLTLDVPDSLAVFGDHDMLQQAVANLLDNALKFSGPNTTVLVAAARPAGQPAMIVVADQGPGIPPADRGRATERFFRGESARSAPGFGLGLAVVQAVAVLHGGSLQLEDNAPGLRAMISLPGAAPLMEPPSREPQHAAISQGA